MNQKTLLIVMLAVTLVATIDSVYGDHAEVTVSITPGSQSDCEANPCYAPSEIALNVGDVVIWSNDGTSDTQIRSGTISDADAGSLFDSELIATGNMYSFKFENAGTYHFFSPVQPWMKGTVVVSESQNDAHEEGGGHKHSIIESTVPVSIDIDVDVDPEGGVNVNIITEGWTWAPENVNGKDVPGEGHAHVYVDGVKINRVYSPHYYLENIEPGERVIRVSLNTNEHNEFTVNGKLAEATQTITVEEGHMDKSEHAPVEATPSMTAEIIMHPDLLGGYNLQVIPTDFVFAGEHVNGEHVPGEGHAHVSIDGNYHTRMYGEWLKMPSLEPGMHTITVGLNANDRSPYYQNGEPVSTSITIHVDDTDKMMDGHDKMEDADGIKMTMIDNPSATGILSDGTVVTIKVDELVIGQQSRIDVVFDDAEQVNYDLVATQNGVDVLTDKNYHAITGSGTHMTNALESDEPLDITIVVQGYGMSKPYTGPIDESVVFTNIVPEFGMIVIVVLGAAMTCAAIFGTRISATLRA